MKVSDSDNIDFFRSQGHTDSEIEIILKNKKGLFLRDLFSAILQKTLQHHCFFKI